MIRALKPIPPLPKGKKSTSTSILQTILLDNYIVLNTENGIIATPKSMDDTFKEYPVANLTFLHIYNDKELTSLVYSKKSKVEISQTVTFVDIFDELFDVKTKTKHTYINPIEIEASALSSKLGVLSGLRTLVTLSKDGVCVYQIVTDEMVVKSNDLAFPDLPGSCNHISMIHDKLVIAFHENFYVLTGDTFRGELYI